MECVVRRLRRLDVRRRLRMRAGRGSGGWWRRWWGRRGGGGYEESVDRLLDDFRILFDPVAGGHDRADQHHVQNDRDHPGDPAALLLIAVARFDQDIVEHRGSPHGPKAAMAETVSGMMPDLGSLASNLQIAFSTYSRHAWPISRRNGRELPSLRSSVGSLLQFATHGGSNPPVGALARPKPV